VSSWLFTSGFIGKQPTNNLFGKCEILCTEWKHRSVLWPLTFKVHRISGLFPGTKVCLVFWSSTVECPDKWSFKEVYKGHSCTMHAQWNLKITQRESSNSWTHNMMRLWWSQHTHLLGVLELHPPSLDGVASLEDVSLHSPVPVPHEPETPALPRVQVLLHLDK